MTNPNITIYNELEQGSDAWLQARCGLLTASTIGKLITPTLKVADNETSRGLTLTLAAERITGHVEYVHPSFEMQRGTEDEPYGRDVYAEHNKVEVAEVGFITRKFDGFTIGYSPDGLVGDDGLIEIKSRSPRIQLAHMLAGEVPKANLAQMQVGMLITERRWCDYVSFSGGLPLWTKRVYPDPAWFEVIQTAAAKFETDIEQIINQYNTAVEGLPMTERRPEIMELKL